MAAILAPALGALLNYVLVVLDSVCVEGTVQGLKTEVVQCSYDDHLMVIVTQIDKMGTLLHARKEERYGTAPTFNVSILMGKRDEPLMVVCARQLIEQISKTGGSRPSILSLGLSDHSAETLKELIKVVVDNKIW